MVASLSAQADDNLGGELNSRLSSSPELGLLINSSVISDTEGSLQSNQRYRSTKLCCLCHMHKQPLKIFL